jgi:hypothetical protein
MVNFQLNGFFLARTTVVYNFFVAGIVIVILVALMSMVRYYEKISGGR